MLQTNVDIAENEVNFQKALEENDNDKMWECVYVACTNICKSIYAKRGYVAQEEELYDTAVNATMMIMRNILERDVKPKKLSSYCYLRCLCYVNGYKQDKLSRKLKDIFSNNMDISSYIEEIYYE